MKRLLLTLIIMLIGINVYAADNDFSIILNGEDYIEEEYKLDVSIDSQNDICGLVMDVSFDSDKLELSEYKGLNGFNATYGNEKMVLDTDNCQKNGKVLSLVFKTKANFKNGEISNISFSNIEGGDGDNLYHAAQLSKTITKQKENPNTGLFISMTTIAFLALGAYLISAKTNKNRKFYN